MIACNLDSIERQVPITPEFRKAIDFLRRPDLNQLPDGTIKLDGDRVFAIVQRYDTVMTGEPRFEFHRKFIDVQFIAAGREVIGWTPAERMSITSPYDADADIAFGVVARDRWTPVLLEAGQAAILWPEDGHAPRLAAGAPAEVVKIVVKIAV